MKKIKTFYKTTLIFTLILTLMIPTFAEETLGIREETVYGLLENNGASYRIIVSEHIQKNADLKSIEITSNLQDIKLLMDDVDYSQNDQMLSFTTDASDLYFRGESSKSLPVTTEIQYYLDDQLISPESLAGQSGHLKMTLKQSNHELRTVTVQGEEIEIFLPFESAIVVNMDNALFENVTTTHGLIVDDGSKKVLTTILTPGLDQSFKDFQSEYLTDEFTLEADVTDMELGSIYMTTICKLPTIDISKYAKELTDVSDQVTDFNGAAEALQEGSTNLNEGVVNYFGKQTEAFTAFNAYIEMDQQLLSSIIGFDSSYTDFNTALTLYTSGITELFSGISQLSQSSPVLATGLSNLKAGLEQVLPQNEQTALLYETLNQLVIGANTLDTGLQQVQVGANKLSASTDQLNVANNELLKASHQIAGGAAQLNDANQSLTTGFNALDQASTQVVSGAQQLTHGVNEFKTEGVDQLVNKVVTSLENIKIFEEKYQAVFALVEDYNSFTGEVNHLESQLVFIMKTDGIYLGE